MTEFCSNTHVLSEIKKGNAEAFEFLFKTYYPRLVRYARRFVRYEDEAGDIVQDSFIAFWEKREQLNDTSITSLLFTIVRNNCINYLKHLNIVENHQINYLANIKGNEQLYHADLLNHPYHKLLYDELNEQIELVVNTLSPRCKEVFRLSRFEGLKNREIAEKLQISATAVEKHISKATQHLLRYFKDKYPSEIFLLIMAWFVA